MIFGIFPPNCLLLKILISTVEFMASPLDVPPIMGVNDDDTEGERHADDKEPFAALAFKIATDPFVGKLTFFRCYSGVLTSGLGAEPRTAKAIGFRPTSNVSA